jgi:general secretion pathway protein D
MAAGLCILAVGCTQGFDTRRRDMPSAPQHLPEVQPDTQDAAEPVYRLPPVAAEPNPAYGTVMQGVGTGPKESAVQGSQNGEQAPPEELPKEPPPAASQNTAPAQATGANKEKESAPAANTNAQKTPADGSSKESAPSAKRGTEKTPDASSKIRTPATSQSVPPAPGAVSPIAPSRPESKQTVPAVKAELVPAPQGTPAATPPTEAKPAEAKPTVQPNGKSSITLHVDGLDVGKVLEMVSRQGGMNILVSPNVKGTVTLDIREKTVEEAIDAIATLCRLQVRQEKDFLYIATKAEVRENEELELPVRVYRLNYVRSTDVEKMVKPLLSKNGRLTSSPDSEVGLPSDAVGAATAGSSETTKEVKGGGNTLAGGEFIVVQDYENVLKMVDRVVAQIDIQPVQVLIEAVIVSVLLDKSLNLGANFAVLDGAGNAVGVLGNGSLINAAAGFAPASVLAASTPNSVTNTITYNSTSTPPTTVQTVTKTSTTGALSNGMGGNTPGVKFGWVGGNTTGFIKALETYGETKVLASPRILVLNKQRAEIHLGKQLGYKTATQTQTTTTETVNFMPVGTQLRLRPFVSTDGMIRMEIHPERSSGELQDGVPQTHASQVTTNVMIPDGATMVIGGLLENEVDESWKGVPLLSRLPWVGFLFREEGDESHKAELVVILTPHIWRPEDPTRTNYLGQPRTEGLDCRVAQKPVEDRRDGPTMYELIRPTCPPESCPQPMAQRQKQQLDTLKTGRRVPSLRQVPGQVQ